MRIYHNYYYFVASMKYLSQLSFYSRLRNNFHFSNQYSNPFQLFNKPYLVNSSLFHYKQLSPIFSHPQSSSKNLLNAPLSPQMNRTQLKRISVLIKQKQSINPNSEELHSSLAACLLLLGQYDEAAGEYSKAWKLNHTSSDYCNKISLCLMEACNYFGAIKLLERQTDKSKVDELTFHNLAIANLFAENYKEAVANLYKSYQINQQIAQEFLQKGEELLKQERYHEAFPFFLKLFIHKSDNEQVLKGLKDCFILGEKIQLGKEIYSYLGEIKEYFQAVEYSLALLHFEDGKIGQSKPHLLVAIEAKQNSYQLNLYLATVYFSEYKFQNAIYHYQRCLTVNPKDPDVLSSLAMSYTKLNSFDKAKLLYENSLSYRESSMAWFGLSLIQFHQKNINKGIKSLQRAIQLDENNYPALQKLGSTYYLLGNQTEGRKMLEKANQIKRQLSEE